MNLMFFLVAICLAIGCLTPNTEAQSDPSDQMSENDEIASALKEALDNLEKEDAASLPEDFSLEEFIQNIDSAVGDSPLSATDMNSKKEGSLTTESDFGAISDALANILEGRAGDSHNDAANDNIASQTTGNDFGAISDALADILAGGVSDPGNDAANEIGSQTTGDDLDATDDPTSDEADEKAEKRRPSRVFSRGRDQRRRLRDRRVKAAPPTVETKTESGSRLERLERRRDRSKERPRRIQNTGRKAGRGIRRTYGERVNNVKEAANNIIETAGSVMETAVDIGAGLQNVAKEVGSGVQDVISKIDFEQLNETAVKTAEYFMQLADWDLPQELVADLLTTRAGGAADTVKAIIEGKELKSIVEDLGKNYAKVWQKMQGGMDLLLGTLLAKSKGAPPA